MECILVPDMALAVAEQFAVKDKNVLVLLTDMTAFADAQKKFRFRWKWFLQTADTRVHFIPDLASRYEKAVDIDGSGSITIIAVTTMPGDDVTHSGSG